jgi:hypothetical protein
MTTPNLEGSTPPTTDQEMSSTPHTTDQETSSAPPTTDQEIPVLVKIADIPGKGKGLVACGPLKRGQLLFAEPALMTLEALPDKESEKEVIADIRKLSREDQRKFFGLSNNFTQYSPITGILATNATLVDTGNTTYYLFTLASRLNHSCSSNAICTWDEAKEEYRVYASRDIEEGEEVVKGSITSEIWVKSRDGRQKDIAESFKYDCLCKTCTMPADEVAASDARRQKYGDFQNSLGALIQHGEDSKVIMYCREMLEILEQEKEGDLKTSMTYRTACLISIRNGDMGRAKAFITLCCEAYVTSHGGNWEEVAEGWWEEHKKKGEEFDGVGKKWKASEKTMRWKDDESFDEWLWAHAY